MAINYPSKITTKNVCLGKRRLEDLAEEYAQGKDVPVMRVSGTVHSMKEETGDYGPYYRFGGAFAALSFVDRAEYRSRAMIMPALAEMIVSEKVKKAIEVQGVESTEKEGYKLVEPVKVLFDVTIQYNPSEKGTRFRFGASDLQPTESIFQDILDSKDEKLFLTGPKEETPKASGAKGGKK